MQGNFLEEFDALRKKTPRLSNINIGSENSDYCTHSDKNKNCYLLFAANFCEDCYYSSVIISCKDCVECSYADLSELCFECIDIMRCYNCNYSQDLRGCRDLDYCYDCISCANLFGCVGLRRKEYHIFNKPVPKEEYAEMVKEWKAKGREAILKEWEKVKLSVPRKAMHEMNNQNCVGDYVTDSKNCYYCFGAHECEDCMYMLDCWHTKDSVDIQFSDGTELCYECYSLGLGAYNCNFCSYIRSCSDCEYCELCFSCKNCFGCIGLQSKQYYILNKPYSKDEYFKKVAEIKAQMKKDGIYGKHLPSTYALEDTAAFQ